jgi:hypothetical protein
MARRKSDPHAAQRQAFLDDIIANRDDDAQRLSFGDGFKMHAI